MPKVLQGKVISTKMQNTIIVEVSRLVPHPLYKKRLTRSKKYKVASNGQSVEIGQMIKIVETKPVSKDKHFAIMTDKKKSAPAPAKKAEQKEVKPKTRSRKEKSK